MKQKQNELYVITKAKELTNYIFVIMEKSPKKYRFTFVSRIQNISLDLLEDLFRANDCFVNSDEGKEKRHSLQQKAITDLRILEYIAMLAMEQGCILTRQYAQISKLSTEVLSLTIKWRNSQK